MSVVGKATLHARACVYMCVTVLATDKQQSMLHDSCFICLGVAFSDRLNTDIAFGNTFGMKTLCVLSGTTQRADLSAAEGTMRPDYVAPSVVSGHKR